MLLNGIKYYHVFTAGNYPQGNFTADQVADIAFYYDPRFREAPVWIGHNKDKSQTLGSEEPKALGWINPVIAIDGKLYIAFSHISEEFFELVQNKKFKYSSVELYLYVLSTGKKIWYLGALGLTNRPAVDGIEPFSFQDKSNFTLSSGFYDQKKFTYEPSEKFDVARIESKMTFTFQINNFNNQNNSNMNLTDNTKKILTSVGIDASKFVTEEAAQEAITKHFTDTSATVTSLQSKVTELEGKITKPSGESSGDPKFTELQNRLSDIENKRAEDLVNNGIAAKKILPADKASFVELAKSNYELAEKTISAMSVHPSLASKQIDTNAQAPAVDVTDPKFTKADGTPLTYEEVIKDAKLQKRFTSEELAELRKQSTYFKK